MSRPRSQPVRNHHLAVHFLSIDDLLKEMGQAVERSNKPIYFGEGLGRLVQSQSLYSIVPWTHRYMSSRTSIQLDRETKELLDRVKRKANAKSYGEAIRLLAKEAMRLQASELGSLPKLRPFRREKNDRFD